MESLQAKEAPKEYEHERLIRVIQNREGATPKDKREAALLELLKMFQYLIKKIATECWRKETGESRADFEHDTLTTFLELVVEDYIPPRYGGQTTFAPYVQSKLYWRTVYRAQKLVKERSRAFAADLAAPEMDFTGKHGGEAHVKMPFFCDVREALLANASNIEDGVLQRMRDEDISKMLQELREIAKAVLDERENFVWESYFFSPLMVREIGAKLDPPIGTSRVNQLVQQVRTKVLAEFARRRIGFTLNS